MILSEIEPKNVFRYFEEICAIPHGSYHTDKIADYTVNFAKTHGLEYTRDKHNNVIIKKPASADYRGNSTVIIQGHLDMVCAKDDNVGIDFENDGLDIAHDGEFVYANGTTLGGDDAIAVAMALAVLESSAITHPNLECVFTTDEEVGMLGATAMDMSSLKGKYMLNIDSEDEGEFTVSCAGGETLIVKFKKENSDKQYFHSIDICISGLLGGHSGVEIDKGRANAVILMGKILGAVKEKTDIQLVGISGGQKDNAIPIDCHATINTNDVDLSLEIINSCRKEIINKYKNVEKEINISADVSQARQGYDCNLIEFISSVTDGVRAFSRDIDGLVETSSNLGVITENEEEVIITFSIRSSVEEEKERLHNEIKCLAKQNGATESSFGKYPAWEYKRDSRLQNICKNVYLSQYGEEPKIAAIHAGLECGIFCNKIEDLDCISFGPNILDIHTTNERLDILSVSRVYRFLIEILKSI